MVGLLHPPRLFKWFPFVRFRLSRKYLKLLEKAIDSKIDIARLFGVAADADIGDTLRFT